MVIKFLKDPLFVFFLLALLLFLLFEQVNEETVATATEQQQDINIITVNQAQIKTLIASFENSWRRAPSNSELNELIEQQIKNEVLYHAALTLELDKNDAIIKHRLQQKMTSVLRDKVNLPIATDQQLQQYYLANQKAYLAPASYSFEHVFIDPSQHKSQSLAKPKISFSAKLSTLAKEINNSKNLAALNLPADSFDPIAIDMKLVNTPSNKIERMFGQAFSSQLNELANTKKLTVWQGPIKSDFGFHFVKITDFSAEQMPSYTDVKTQVLADWQQVQQNQLQAVQYQKLKQQYQINVAKLKP
ncbi:MAG: peptidyl-prolyl cis-trans isomerase [Thalassotalea sp.]